MKSYMCAVAVAGTLLWGAASQAQSSSDSLQITAGSWGYAGQRKDVKADVAGLCDGKPSCKFMVSNETLSLAEPKDPAPGHDKGLILKWTCGETPHLDQFPEGKNAELSCP